jgi:hypothetical protein
VRSLTKRKQYSSSPLKGSSFLKRLCLARWEIFFALKEMVWASDYR